MRILMTVLALIVTLNAAANAQSITFRPGLVSLYAGGNAVTVSIIAPTGTRLTRGVASPGLKVEFINGFMGPPFYRISAPKTMKLGDYALGLEGKLGNKTISGLLKVRVIRRNKPPSIDAFSVSSSVTIQGDRVNFSARVSDPDGDPLTCALDVDSDGKADYTLKSCKTLEQPHSYKSAGVFKPRLVVTDGFAGKTESPIAPLLGSNGFVLTVEARGSTFKVTALTDTQDVLPGDGRCADAQGQCSLRAAIMELNGSPGVGFVELPGGTHTLTLEGEDQTAQRGDLDIVGKIQITGQGADSTILDAGGKNRAFEITSSGRLWLSNVTVRNGQTVRPYLDLDGGAILGNPNTVIVPLEVSNCVFEDNVTGGSGGAISGKAIVRNSVFRRNTAASGGGALSGSFEISDSSISENKAGNGGGGLLGNQTNVRRTIIEKNTSRSNGGGVILTGGELRNVIVRGNTALDGSGGGLLMGFAPLQIIDSLIDGNSAKIGGGIDQYSREALTLVNTVISNNIASESAGGIRSTAGLTVAFSSIVRNQAKQSAGGLLLPVRSGAVDAFKGLLLAENAAPQGPDCLGTITSKGYNFVMNPADCLFSAAHRNSAGVVTDRVGENPGLSDLTDGFFGLLPAPMRSSKAVNWVPKVDCTLPDGKPLAADIAGRTRLAGTGCAVGAVEVRP